MLAANNVSASVAKRYDERVWKRLGKELAISTRLQQLADRAWLFDFVVDRANRNPALADTISCMFTDLDLRERLKPLDRKTQPYAKRIAHTGIWVEPKLLAEIEYRAKSADGKARRPFFKGLLEDL